MIHILVIFLRIFFFTPYLVSYIVSSFSNLPDIRSTKFTPLAGPKTILSDRNLYNIETICTIIAISEGYVYITNVRKLMVFLLQN